MLPSIVAHSNLQQMCELLSTLPSGDVAEIGVFQGGSASWLYKNCLTEGRTLHLFDTFSGTPFAHQELDKHKPGGEFAAPGAPDNIRRMMPLAKLYIGIFPHTMPDDLPDLAFVHCDCDQYLSYRAVIDKLWPKVLPGGVLLFDDYPYLAGAKKAVLESFSESELKTCGSRFYVQKTAEEAKLDEVAKTPEEGESAS